MQANTTVCMQVISTVKSTLYCAASTVGVHTVYLSIECQAAPDYTLFHMCQAQSSPTPPLCAGWQLVET
jgi:hypothetical protein